MSKSHRLAARPTLRVADLKHERFLWTPRKESPRIYDEIIAAFRAHHLTPEIAHEEATSEVLLMRVASGEGLCAFPESAAPNIPPGAVFKRVRDLDVAILGRAVWRATDEKDPLVHSLREISNSVHATGASRMPQAVADEDRGVLRPKMTARERLQREERNDRPMALGQTTKAGRGARSPLRIAR